MPNDKVKNETKQSSNPTFLKLYTLSNHSFSMDNKGPINSASERNHYNSVIVYHFRNYIATVPTPKNNADYAVNAKIQHWISKFGPPQNLVTDRGTKNPISEKANSCTLFNVLHSPRTSYDPWTYELVEV